MFENKVLGVKNDERKNRFELVPWGVLEQVVKVLGFGAKKYQDWNWLHVERWRDRYFAATIRHLVAWREGEVNDPESGLSHLAHAAMNVMFLLGREMGVVAPDKG